MLLPHHPEILTTLRPFTVEDPLRLLISGCMAGLACGVTGDDYGFGGVLSPITSLPTVRTFAFCPEDAGLGTPRTWPDIEGGDGFDVLDGTARVIDQHGTDLSAGMIDGAQKMAAFAVENRIEVAILLDMSGACGSQVISDGTRFVDEKKYRRGVGVATAALLRAGVHVVSQRDNRTLHRLVSMLDPTHVIDENAVDHHEREWYRTYFQIV
jgi:uncharacterized protein YbbK (DUF523 family)